MEKVLTVIQHQYDLRLRIRNESTCANVANKQKKGCFNLVKKDKPIWWSGTDVKDPYWPKKDVGNNWKIIISVSPI